MARSKHIKEYKHVTEHRSNKQALKEFLARPDIIDRFRHFSRDDLQGDGSISVQEIIEDASTHYASGATSLEQLLRYSTTVFQIGSPPYKAYKDVIALRKSNPAVANHRERRSLIHEFGLNTSQVSFEMLKATGRHPILGEIHIIKCDHVLREARWPRFTKISEQPGPQHDHLRGGHKIVQADTSAIFFTEVNGEFRIQLVVLRGLLNHAMLGGDFYKFAREVVDYAVEKRRNIRPTHDGGMVQSGWNAGPRHARVFGLAKSYTRKLSDSEKLVHDTDVVGLAGIMWSIVSTMMPVELVDEAERLLSQEELPRFATRHVKPGDGYQIEAQKTFILKQQRRSPPEFYMSRGYTAPIHTDPSYSPFTFSWTVHRAVETTTSDHVHSLKRAPLDNGGANFYAASIDVLVLNASGTLMAHRAEESHCTTVSTGAVNWGVSIPFSGRLVDALKKSQTQIDKGEQVVTVEDIKKSNTVQGKEATSLLKKRPRGRGCQYLVRWKDSGPDSWIAGSAARELAVYDDWLRDHSEDGE